MNRYHKKIVNPIFTKCVEYIECLYDPKNTEGIFWKQIFTELAYGRYPKSSGVSNNVLYIKKGGETTTLVLSNDPEEVYFTVSTMLRNKLGLISDRERQTKKDEISDVKKRILDSSKYSAWSKIKIKNTKELLLYNFSFKKKKELGLTYTQTKELYSLIRLKLYFFRTISSKEIILKDGEIDTIIGLVYDKKRKEFSLEDSREIQTSSADTKNMVDMDVMWTKYLRNLEKRNMDMLGKIRKN